VNRQDFYKFQVVGQADLDTLEDDVEVADAKDNALTSLGSYPATGLAVTVDGVTLVLSVAAGGGLATDASGNPRRVNLGAPANINLASAVPAVDPRWVLVALHFKRFEHQDVTDGDNVTLKYYLDESSELVMVQGAEGGAKPAIPADHVPLVDVRLIAAQAALARKDLDFIRCRPAWARNQGGAAQQLGDIAGAGFDNCRGFVVEPQASNAMKVGVRPGTFNLSDQLVTVAAGQTVTVPASPSGGKHRITLVYIDQAGTLQMAHGAEVVYAAQATAPSFEGRFPVAVYDVLDTTTALDPANLVDVRPHQRMARDVPNRYKFTRGRRRDHGHIGNGWTFIVGAHALSVYKNGLLLAESAYAENAAGDGINGLAALGGGDVVDAGGAARGRVEPDALPRRGARGRWRRPDRLQFGRRPRPRARDVQRRRRGQVHRHPLLRHHRRQAAVARGSHHARPERPRGGCVPLLLRLLDRQCRGDHRVAHPAEHGPPHHLHRLARHRRGADGRLPRHDPHDGRRQQQGARLPPRRPAHHLPRRPHPDVDDGGRRHGEQRARVLADRRHGASHRRAVAGGPAAREVRRARVRPHRRREPERPRPGEGGGRRRSARRRASGRTRQTRSPSIGGCTST
jgi:hypothetical protein